jgi:hypothetical protein
MILRERQRIVSKAYLFGHQSERRSQCQGQFLHPYLPFSERPLKSNLCCQRAFLRQIAKILRPFLLLIEESSGEFSKHGIFEHALSSRVRVVTRQMLANLATVDLSFWRFVADGFQNIETPRPPPRPLLNRSLSGGAQGTSVGQRCSESESELCPKVSLRLLVGLLKTVTVGKFEKPCCLLFKVNAKLQEQRAVACRL